MTDFIKVYGEKYKTSGFSYKLSQNPNITSGIVQANLDNPWNWECLSLNPKLPWDWSTFSLNQNITWDIVKNNPDKKTGFGKIIKK